MFIRHIQLKDFRCFSDQHLDFERKVILLEGMNGMGKTSVLEALHYVCYLRSFRTHTSRELVRFDKDTFFIKVGFEQEELARTASHELQVGFSGKKRLVKLDNKAIQSYKELMDFYRIITLTEDDLELIKGGPDVRRSFMDQAIMLYNPGFATILKAYKTILENRNSLLQHGRPDQDSYQLWTEQLWYKAGELQAERIQFLEQLEAEITQILTQYFPYDLQISFSYTPKRMELGQEFQAFLQQQKQLYEQECRFGRSLFGAHLDDVIISFQGSSSRLFASRGQQKLIILLIKTAQLKALAHKKGPAVFLLDDFMTDFDQERAERVLAVLADLESQLIFTAPSRSTVIEDILKPRGLQKIEITN